MILEALSLSKTLAPKVKADVVLEPLSPGVILEVLSNPHYFPRFQAHVRDLAFPVARLQS